MTGAGGPAMGVALCGSILWLCQSYAACANERKGRSCVGALYLVVRGWQGGGGRSSSEWAVGVVWTTHQSENGSEMCVCVFVSLLSLFSAKYLFSLRRLGAQFSALLLYFLFHFFLFFDNFGSRLLPHLLLLLLSRCVLCAIRSWQIEKFSMFLT